MIFRVFFFFPCLILLACSSSQESTQPESKDQVPIDSLVKRHAKPYDPAKGGLQITYIAYDQNGNGTIAGILNEWIELESAVAMSTAGWYLNAGDVGQDYFLPDSIHKFLRIYTQPKADLN